MNNGLIHYAVVAAVVGVLFLLLWWQGQIQRLSVYVQETREELKKCSWPSWIELRGSTILIIVTVGLLALFVFLVDQLLIRTYASAVLQMIVIVAGAVVVAVKSKAR